MIIEEANKFGKLSDIELKDFEQHNSILLPADYKEFLLKFNGGRPSFTFVPQVKSDVQYLYGMHNDPAWASLYNAINVFSGRIPSWYIPIGYDSGGNQYIMSLYHENLGVIGFWNHEGEANGDASQYYGNIVLTAESFSELLSSLTQSINW